MMKIVITGGSGLLALNWAYAMRHHTEVILFTHNHDVRMEHVESRRVSLFDSDTVNNVIKGWGANLVVHTAGLTNVDECERNPEIALNANAAIAGNVAHAACELGLPLVHISTDHLFPGNVAFVDEQEPTNPVNAYGRSKLEGEKRVLKHHSKALIVRTNFFGWGYDKRLSFSDWVLQSLRNSCEISVFHDVYFTPVLIDHLVTAVNGLVDKHVAGVVNVAGDQRISKYEFALAVADEFGLDKSLIKKVSIMDVPLIAKRPRDMSLSNNKVVKILGRGISSVDVGLQALHEQERQGRPKVIQQAISGND